MRESSFPENMTTETLWAVAFVAKSVRNAIGLCYVISIKSDRVYKDSLTQDLEKSSVRKKFYARGQI